MASSETTPLLQDPTSPSIQHEEERINEPHGTFARNLGAFDGFALLISVIIGSGVFSSSGLIDTNVPSPGASLLIWLLGGILAWTGALTMAELGTTFPGEGGVQPYLTYAFGEVFGYMAAWSWIVATMPATLAILSIVFVESTLSCLGIYGPDSLLWHKLLALLVLVTVTTMNSISTKTSTRLSGFFVAVKLLTVLLLGIAGLVAVGVFVVNKKDLGGGDWHRRNWFKSRVTVLPGRIAQIDWNRLTTWEILGYISTALYGALWAYCGWDKANYVAAELRNPSRQLPLSINTAIPTIIVCYVAANAVYYVLLPWDTISSTDAVAVVAMDHFLGKAGAYITTILICLVIAGSALGNSFVAGRMTVAAANKKWFPPIFGSVGKIGTFKIKKTAKGDAPASAEEAMDDGESPINALLLNTFLSAIYIIFGNMRILLTFNGLAEYAFFFLTVLGAIVLRYREPELPRPVKPFILVPIVFALISGFVVVRGAVFAPLQAAVLLSIWAVGLVYFYFRRWVLRKDE